MFRLAEYRERPANLADYLPWTGLVAPGVVLNKDGSFQRTARFRGPDLDSATPAELIATTARINNALKRLGSGWALFVEAERRAASGYPSSEFSDPLSWLIEEERRGAFEAAGSHFESNYFLTTTYLPSRETRARAGQLLLETDTKGGVDWREQLGRFVTETDRFLTLFEGVMPEIGWLSDAEVLTYLHATVSTRYHPVDVPEVSFHLDALLSDEPLTAGLSPLLGDQHLRIVTVRGFPTSTWPGLLDELNRLAFPYRWVTRFLLLDKADAERELVKLRRQWFAKRKNIVALLRESVFQQESPLVDSDADNKAADADAALQELGSDAVAYGYVTATVVVMDSSAAAADDKRKVIERVIQGRGFVTIAETFNAVEAWLSSIPGHVDNISRMRALGFCVSVEHARFMARVFQPSGVAAIAIWSDTPESERRKALLDLAARRINIIFSVDLFHEGIDVPGVDMLLMLRPTDSATLFLQQLGRGLRRSVGKTVCTVLDFVGHHRKEFRFDRRLRALLGGTRRELEEQIATGFPFLPAGCHMELDRVASQIVLDNVRHAVPSRRAERVQALRSLAAGATSVALPAFLAETGLELEEVYANNVSWSDLCQEAGLTVQPPGPHERLLRRACGRLLHVDDRERIATYREFLGHAGALNVETLATRQRRLLRMLVGSVVDSAVNSETTLEEGAALLLQHPQVRHELRELLGVRAERIEHVSVPLTTHPEVPLGIHARYTRVEILAAFGIGNTARVAPWQSGVYWAKDAQADLFAFTLDKTSGSFSPTTRYKDYAVSRDLIHWESQSVTRAESPTGQRYQRHTDQGASVMLFARRRSDERAFYFLGPATYVKHESELPMAITWRLHHPLPGDLFAAFAAAVA